MKRAPFPRPRSSRRRAYRHALRSTRRVAERGDRGSQRTTRHAAGGSWQSEPEPLREYASADAFRDDVTRRVAHFGVQLMDAVRAGGEYAHTANFVFSAASRRRILELLQALAIEVGNAPVTESELARARRDTRLQAVIESATRNPPRRARAG